MLYSLFFVFSDNIEFKVSPFYSRFSVRPKFILMPPTISPRKNSLSISLTESVVFLRSVDVSTHRPTTRENTPPSILRGLLILSLVKPTRISSIQVDFVGQSITTWTEGTLSYLSPIVGFVHIHIDIDLPYLPRRAEHALSLRVA